MTGTHPRRAAVTRLRLANFRSYAALDLAAGEGSVALVGPNGAGKTNILEAISLLAPGRGLRRAPHGEFARVGGDGSWAVAAEVAGDDGTARLGTGTEPSQEGAGRRCRVDGAPVPGAGAFAAHLRLVWLTPDLDGLFRGSAGDRRRFLDRLVLAVDPEHAGRASGLEKALRSRNRLLEESGEPRWIDAVERELAELAVAIAAARLDVARRLAGLIAEGADPASPFPSADIALDGTLEAELAHRPATEVEDAYRARLGRGRPRDRAAGRTLEGPHLSDLVVRHAAKDMPAEKCSTGEQKALLVGLVLAHARLVARLDGRAPVALLDEISAHLDPARRAALYADLDALGAQVWLTGADPAAFAELGPRATVFSVADGAVLRARAG
ncbi:DNA replication/repair protein RecF [Methylopila turkensis]|nr:DNA replication/repair protein RecF [Methylopila turkensis]